MSLLVKAESDHLSPATGVSDKRTDVGYGRSRLWLGITAVGTFVVLCVLGLALDLPQRWIGSIDTSFAKQALMVAGFVLTYVLVQLPFDVLGGFVLPRRFGRQHLPLARYMPMLLRGVAMHATLLWLMAMAITVAGAYAGIVGVVAAGLIGVLLLLWRRTAVARLLAKFSPTGSGDVDTAGLPRTTYLKCADEGFTGNITGVFRPRAQVLPTEWRERLDADAFTTVLRRRAIAVSSGSWLRGRLLAISFTLAGLALAGWLVGPQHLGQASGTIELSLWFSLWSFAGLLVLPTLSRRAAADIDWRVVDAGASRDSIDRMSRQLDALQDGEPFRPGVVETIFHTIPSAGRRVGQIEPSRLPGFWDVARTSIYLSIAGGGLLGRAVHCNCGRPALWAFLPTD